MDLSWANKYIRIPYRSEGCDSDGVSCWGLCRLVYKNELGIELPEYGDFDHSDLKLVNEAISEGQRSSNWKRIEVPGDLSFDLVLINRSIGELFLPAHIGIVTQPGYLMHAEENVNIVHIPFRDGPGFRVHRDMLGRVHSIWRYRPFISAMI